MSSQQYPVITKQSFNIQKQNKGLGKKVISFSLWGNKPIYMIGAIKSAELALQFYPEFECRFYVHINSVPTHIIENLQKKTNVKIIFKSGIINLLNPMMWRFETIDDPDVEINMSRDTDTRILLREKLAVDEWLASGKTFHIMRDHPHHINETTPIMGGMFGTKKIKDIASWTNLIEYINQKDGDYRLYAKDQEFLYKYIYPHIINDCLIHSTFGGVQNEKFENIKPFPIKYCDNYYFVGGYIYEDENVSKRHIDILINAINNS